VEGPHRATKREAIEAWNTRAQAARIAELEDEDAAFERVWAVVKDWDISTEPGAMRLYEGINGDHVRAIVRAALMKKEGE